MIRGLTMTWHDDDKKKGGKGKIHIWLKVIFDTLRKIVQFCCNPYFLDGMDHN